MILVPPGWSRPCTSSRTSSAIDSAPRRHSPRWHGRGAGTIPPDGPPRRHRRVLASLLFVVLATYAALLLILWLSESRLLYFPGPRGPLLDPPAWLRLPVERVELRTPDGLRLVAWAMRAEEAGA